ncbi:unnamed protein product, partial [Trichogramma brassicae]
MFFTLSARSANAWCSAQRTAHMCYATSRENREQSIRLVVSFYLHSTAHVLSKRSIIGAFVPNMGGLPYQSLRFLPVFARIRNIKQRYLQHGHMRSTTMRCAVILKKFVRSSSQIVRQKRGTASRIGREHSMTDRWSVVVMINTNIYGQTLMPKTPAQRERRRVQQQRSRARKREEDQQRTRQIDPRPPLRITARKILDLPLPPWASQQHVALSMPSLEYDIEEARPSVRSVVVVPPTNHHLYYDPEHPEFLDRNLFASSPKQLFSELLIQTKNNQPLKLLLTSCTSDGPQRPLVSPTVYSCGADRRARRRQRRR